MGIHLITESSLWLGLICLVVAAGYAILFYRNDRFLKDVEVWKVRMMMGLRFLSVFFISFLLLSPLIRTISRFIEKPIIIFAMDNSESLMIRADSANFRKILLKQFQDDLIQPLEEEFDFSAYCFGSELREGFSPDFRDKETHISELIEEIKTRFVNRNVGALILASDGLYNKGINPLYPAGDLNFPIYSLALGDTNVRKDVRISEVNYNKISFLRNRFPIQVRAEVSELPGVTTRLTISSNQGVVLTRDIQSSGNHHVETLQTEIEAKSVGIQRFRVALSTVKGEENLRNNVRDIVVEVIDSRKRVVLLSAGPHPDIAAIRNALAGNENYQVDVMNISDFQGSLQPYHLVVFHQVPAKNKSGQELISQVFKLEIPALFILGGQSSLSAVNAMRAGLSIQQSRDGWEESFPRLNPSFSLFEPGQDLKDLSEGFPPLVTPFGDYSTNDKANVLFYQRIKSVETTKPLFFFNQVAGHKLGFFCGEGLWRWRMNNFVQQGNHLAFDEMMGRIVQYLSLSANKERFVVRADQVFGDNEPVVFSSELYNESFQPVNQPEVKLEIFDANGKKYPFAFSRLENSYRLNAGLFPVGDYRYSANVVLAGKPFSFSGRFSVIPVDLEARNTVANHRLMAQLAQNHNGQMFFPGQEKALVELLRANQEIAPVSITEEKLQEWIQWKLLFFFLLILLSAEWFFRKFYGSY